MNDVVENGPAWESGVRAGDVIVTVNDWLIVLMDRPQVIWSALRLMMTQQNVLYTASSLGVHSFERKNISSKITRRTVSTKHFSSFLLSWL